jgi:hypothetical protein
MTNVQLPSGEVSPVEFDPELRLTKECALLDVPGCGRLDTGSVGGLKKRRKIRSGASRAPVPCGRDTKAHGVPPMSP